MNSPLSRRDIFKGLALTTGAIALIRVGLAPHVGRAQQGDMPPERCTA